MVVVELDEIKICPKKIRHVPSLPSLPKTELQVQVTGASDKVLNMMH